MGTSLRFSVFSRTGPELTLSRTVRHLWVSTSGYGLSPPCTRLQDWTKYIRRQFSGTGQSTAQVLILKRNKIPEGSSPCAPGLCLGSLYKLQQTDTEPREQEPPWTAATEAAKEAELQGEAEGEEGGSSESEQAPQKSAWGPSESCLRPPPERHMCAPGRERG